MAQNTRALPSKTDYYHWRVAGKPLSVVMSLQFVSRLEEELNGFHADSQRVLTGILLGRVISGPAPSVFVEEYAVAPSAEAAPFEHAQLDNGSFENLIQQWRPAPHSELVPVGFFRTQTSGWLDLDENDLAIARKFFAAAYNVILLIRRSQSRANTGAIFTWDSPGRISSRSSDCEFLFNARLLKDLQTNRSIVSGAESGKPMLRVPGAQPVREPLPSSKYLAVLAVVGLLCIVGLFVLFRGRPEESAARPANTVVEAPQTGEIGLAVKRSQGDLSITWDRSSRLFAGGATGMLLIYDGTSIKSKVLDSRQLQEGQVLYSPLSGDVNVRLVVTTPQGKSRAESVQTMTGELLAPPARYTPTTPPRIQPDSSLVSRLAPGSAAKSSGNAPKSFIPPPPAIPAGTEAAGNPVSPVTRLEGEAAHHQIPVANVPGLVFLDSIQRSLSARHQIPAANVPVAREDATPLPQTVAAIPLPENPPAAVSKPSFTPDHLPEKLPVAAIVGPQVVRQVKPQVPAYVLNKITSEQTIDVQVNLNQEGQVVSATVVKRTGALSGLLTSAAVDAARHWVFKPAQRGDRTIPSEHTISFVFSPRR